MLGFNKFFWNFAVIGDNRHWFRTRGPCFDTSLIWPKDVVGNFDVFSCDGIIFYCVHSLKIRYRWGNEAMIQSLCLLRKLKIPIGLGKLVSIHRADQCKLAAHVPGVIVWLVAV